MNRPGSHPWLFTYGTKVRKEGRKVIYRTSVTVEYNTAGELLPLLVDLDITVF